MDKILIIPLLLSFFISLFFIPSWIKKAKEIGLVWEDMNKINSEKVAGSGGIIVILGFIMGVLFFVAYRTFYLKNSEYLISVLVILIVVLLAGGLGLIDDLLGWRRGGLSKKARILFILISAIPLMAINVAKAPDFFYHLGLESREVAFLYMFVLVPIGILGVTTTFNFLAGFNGLEAGQGIILLSSLSIIAFLRGDSWLSVVALCMVAALIGFIYYNFFPAKVFPGDSLTYAVGSLIAVISIIGHFEIIAAFFFIPYIIEFFLKVRGKLNKYSFGKPNQDGSLSMAYEKIYGLEHAAIWFFEKVGLKAKEKRVTFLIWSFQILIICLGFIIFKKMIFI